mmetsp:Transcript_28150/g.66660  ORF Transcript_28150/g.66660 Transcript_28150/m.66660 type:complete len:173 (-) Transcript_28150:67-585(-)
MFSSSCDENLQRTAHNHGVVTTQFVVTPYPEWHSQAEVKAIADIALDTPGFNGHSTSAWTRWAGVPLVTEAGAWIPGRVGASHALALGPSTTATLARNWADYVDVAGRLMKRRDLLSSLRHKLSAERDASVMFDTRRWVGRWQRGLRLLWDATLAEADKFHIIVADTAPVDD